MICVERELYQQNTMTSITIECIHTIKKTDWKELVLKKIMLNLLEKHNLEMKIKFFVGISFIWDKQ